MNRRKQYLEDLEESKQHGGHVIRNHRKPPTGNGKRAVAATVLAAALLITVAPVAGTPTLRGASAAPVVDAEGIEMVDLELTTQWEIDRLKESVARSKQEKLITSVALASVAVPTWIHPLASSKRGNSCYRTARRPSHGGVDMAQPYGTPIRSVAKGSVYRKAYERGGAGFFITIRHAGNVFSQYHHLRASSPLSVGTPVQVGQVIGYVGATGNATGNHLHFEIRTGSVTHRVNPAAFMRGKGISIGC